MKDAELCCDGSDAAFIDFRKRVVSASLCKASTEDKRVGGSNRNLILKIHIGKLNKINLQDFSLNHTLHKRRNLRLSFIDKVFK